MLAGKFVMLVALKERRLRRQQGAHLLEQAGAVGWVHGYELNGHSVSVSDATHNGAATHLPDRKIKRICTRQRIGTHSLVRTNRPPMPRLSTNETPRFVPACQAATTVFGGFTRG